MAELLGTHQRMTWVLDGQAISSSSISKTASQLSVAIVDYSRQIADEELSPQISGLTPAATR